MQVTPVARVTRLPSPARMGRGGDGLGKSLKAGQEPQGGASTSLGRSGDWWIPAMIPGKDDHRGAHITQAWHTKGAHVVAEPSASAQLSELSTSGIVSDDAGNRCAPYTVGGSGYDGVDAGFAQGGACR